jgi:hypothetical protein
VYIDFIDDMNLNGFYGDGEGAILGCEVRVLE